jgi:hypothetical protein
MPEKPGKLMPALYGGVIMGVISGVPILSFINCFCCAGIMLGGFMAVFFYKKDLKESSPLLSNADGLALGALAGLVGAVVTTVLTALMHLVFGMAMGGGMQRLQDMGLGDRIPPETMRMIQGIMSDKGLLGIAFIFHLVIDPLFGLIGGLIGYAVFKSKVPPVMPPPPPVPHQ